MSGRNGTDYFNYPTTILGLLKSEPRRIMESLESNNTTSYRRGPNTFSFTYDSSRSKYPLDGKSQLFCERKHSDSWSTSMHWSPCNGRVTAALGSEKDRIKWFRDQQGAGLAWEHKVRHSPIHSSHIETGARHDNGPISGFIRWALGFN